MFLHSSVKFYGRHWIYRGHGENVLAQFIEVFRPSLNLQKTRRKCFSTVNWRFSSVCEFSEDTKKSHFLLEQSFKIKETDIRHEQSWWPRLKIAAIKYNKCYCFLVCILDRYLARPCTAAPVTYVMLPWPEPVAFLCRQHIDHDLRHETCISCAPDISFAPFSHASRPLNYWLVQLSWRCRCLLRYFIT
jgi:hypothetical protein